jgi:hypothetical protein
VIVESKVFPVLDKIKYVRMRAGKFLFGLLAKCVMPDYPVTHHKPKLVSYNSDMCGVIIPNSDIK